ncbi:MAG: DUF362 domain-containing protein, partial [Ignavibacteriae bacterium]|nr:DUF362 domain-containing protein [Ignavibacteriota bacterium]
GIVGPSAITSNSTTAEFPTAIVDSLNPFGDAIGIFPGRVVWVHRADATNENCDPRAALHEWYRPENNNQGVIDTMVSTAIRGLTGEATDSAAWNVIFRFHNTRRGRGNVGYASGEKIFIKINVVSSWNGNFNPVDLSARTDVVYRGVSETSPAIVLSVLRQLVIVVGVAQSDIYVGDPMRHIYKHAYDLWHAEFPNAHYLDVSGYENLGRERVVKSTTARVKYSDRGTVLRSGGTTGTPIYEDSLYTIFEQATYMLNVPMLKGHKRAGVTMFAKNHFGSHVRASASHVHGGLVAPNEENPPTRSGYGLYRVQVDLHGHELLGKRNLFYLMDALWATDYELDTPLKWMMQPFNNDWMSSMFASLDPIAIESVGYDFLRTEFTSARGAGTYVQMYGTDDYLHQAADTTRWATGIRYDPENDGTVLGSLGVHEHWNSGALKQYTRNLGIGNGIELIKLNTTAVSVQLVSFRGTYAGNNRVQLAWRTISEISNYGFFVQRKLTSASEWNELPEFVAGHGTTNQPHDYASTDQSAPTGVVLYRLKQVDLDGTIHLTEPITINTVTSVPDQSPVEFVLMQNYPNPFNPTTLIRFSVASRNGRGGESENVSLKVFDVLGKEVRTLVNENLQAGSYETTFDATGLASGVYIYRLQSGGMASVRTLLLLR